MTVLIIAVLVLYVVQAFVPSMIMSRAVGGKAMIYAAGPRDEPQALTVAAARAKRAMGNMVEATVVFLPLALLAVHYSLNDGLAYWGAVIFLLARIAYVPAYISALGLARSVVWTVGHIGLVMMGWAVLMAS